MNAVLLLLMVAVFSGPSFVEPAFELHVQLISYSNPLHTLGTHPDVQCCDGTDLPQECTMNCDNRFILCLRDSQITSSLEDIASSCTYQVYTTRPTGSDDVVFGDEIQLSPQLPSATNPLLFTGDEWPDEAQLAIEVLDADDPQGLTNDQYIDTILMDLANLTPSSTIGPMLVTGVVSHGTFSLAASLNCSENYYGSSCSIFCQPKNDSTGHYTCDAQGNAVCLQGYTNVSSSCLQCVPSTGCSTVGGYCNLPGECLCKTGYDGTHCEIDNDPCGHQLPCLHGNCTNIGPNTYQCSCVEGFVGVNCEHNSTCTEGICRNGGTCVNGVCLCADGFTGEQCQESSILLVTILASCLTVTVIVLLVSVVIVVLCIVRTKRRNKSQKMKSMDLHIPSPTDDIQLHTNPGYAPVTQPEQHYYSQIDAVPHGRTNSLPLKAHLSTQRSSDYYVNEGLGPPPRRAVTVTMATLVQPHLDSQKMKSMDLHIPSPTDDIQLHTNPGHAPVTQPEQHYYSQIDAVPHGRTASLPLKAHLSTQRSSDYYVNEGLGPPPRRAATVTMATLLQPHLDDGNYAIPHSVSNSSTNLVT